MRDLVQLSNEELNELTTAQRLRMLIAVGVSIACGIISLHGMAAVFTDATVVPLPGMQHLSGQIGWAVALIVMLLLVTFLVRGVIKRRLQWAIALSLLIHFLLCLSMTTVDFRGPLPKPAQAADFADVPREEFTLPDYAVSDVPDADAVWRQQNDTETPDREQDPERPEMEIAETEKAETQDVEIPRVADSEETPERNEKLEIEADAVQQMQRQSATEMNVESEIAVAPDVESAAKAQDASLEAQIEQSKLTADIPDADRELEESESPEMQIEAAEVQANRSESKVVPEAVSKAEAEKSSSFTAAVEAKLDVVNISSKEATESTLKARASDLARQAVAAAESTSEPRMQAGVTTIAAEPSVEARVPSLSRRPEFSSFVAPAETGATTLARAAASSPTVVSGSSVDEGVVVSSAGKVTASAVAESANSRSAGRSSNAMASGGSMSEAEEGSSGGVASPDLFENALSGIRVAKSESVGANRPEIGTESGLSVTPSRRASSVVGAAGAAADESRLGNIGAADQPSADGLIVSPSRASAGRRNTGLPIGTVSGEPGKLAESTAGSGGNGPVSAANSGTLKAVTGGANGVRGTEPDAKLSASDGFAGGSRPGMARSQSKFDLPGGSEAGIAAERGGALVVAGPQSAGAGVAAMARPRTQGLPRRSAGLPGANGPAASSAQVGIAGGPSLSSRVPSSSARKGVGADRPALASTEAIAGLVKKSVQGRSGSPEALIPESLSMRTTDARREAAKTLGGSEESEEAVERGLLWLARNQYPDGHWSINDFPGETSESLGEGSFVSNSAATGLSLLAFLGAGYTHQSGKHKEVVSRGMFWLLKHQKPDGDLFADETKFVWFYSHGIASIALCEAYGLTKDPELKAPAQRALDFILASQHQKFGGWRYRPQFESDTSVSGWQLMALKSGEMAGLKVSKDAYAGVSRWLDSVQSKADSGQFSYHPTMEASPAMTAEGLLMRQYLGAKREDTQLIAGANYLRTRLPDFGQRDAYYWYYATQVMFHMQGEHWNEWNNSLRNMLITTQSKDGSVSGSWDPLRPAPDKWAVGGGRHYLTCLNLLMLEVYYRHLPLYLELEK